MCTEYSVQYMEYGVWSTYVYAFETGTHSFMQSTRSTEQEGLSLIASMRFTSSTPDPEPCGDRLHGLFSCLFLEIGIHVGYP